MFWNSKLFVYLTSSAHFLFKKLREKLWKKTQNWEPLKMMKKKKRRNYRAFLFPHFLPKNRKAVDAFFFFSITTKCEKRKEKKLWWCWERAFFCASRAPHIKRRKTKLAAARTRQRQHIKYNFFVVIISIKWKKKGQWSIKKHSCVEQQQQQSRRLVFLSLAACDGKVYNKKRRRQH